MKTEMSQNPSKHDIQILFKTMQPDFYCEQYKALDVACDELREKLLNVPAMKNLEKKKSAAYNRHHERKKEIEGKISKVRRRYLSRGLTPKMLKEIQALVDEINRMNVK